MMRAMRRSSDRARHATTLSSSRPANSARRLRRRCRRTSNLLLAGRQVLLRSAFAARGYTHAFGFDQASIRLGTGWMADVGRWIGRRSIGMLEIIGAVGLILPAATGILPSSTHTTPQAAPAVPMVLSIVPHARRRRRGQEHRPATDPLGRSRRSTRLTSVPSSPCSAPTPRCHPARNEVGIVGREALARRNLPQSTRRAQAAERLRRRSNSRRRRLLGRPSPRTSVIPGPVLATTGGLWST